MTEKKLLSTFEVSKLINRSDYTVRKYARDGKLKGYKFGGKKYIFDRDEVLETVKKFQDPNKN